MAVSYDFTGRTAVVTGASKGIGRRIAERLRDAGAQVWNFDLSPTLIDHIGEIRVDVTDASQIAAAVARSWRSPHA
jgi:NAD(P)-dependent dehydrogenase (short-subunit alcohol dehydrogenase family)